MALYFVLAATCGVVPSEDGGRGIVVLWDRSVDPSSLLFQQPARVLVSPVVGDDRPLDVHWLAMKRTAAVLSMLFALGRAQAQETETYVLHQAVSNRERLQFH